MAILIVDDDFGIRESLSQLLQEEGFEVLTAANGEEALGLLHTGGVSPCLILLDLMMPGLNGWEFRNQQMQNALLASIPVAILSADRNLKEHAAQLNVAEYIDKPVDLDLLFRVIDRYCT